MRPVLERAVRAASRVLEGESYFATCDRDEKGRCLPSGAASGSQSGTGPKILSPEEARRVAVLFSDKVGAAAMSFDEALADRSSAKHVEAATYAEGLLEALPGWKDDPMGVISAVGDTSAYGAEPSVVSFHTAPRDTVDEDARAAAASIGLKYGQMSVLVSVEDAGGKDAFRSLTFAPGVGLPAVRAALDAEGIEFRTIHPESRTVYVHDFDAKLGDAVARAARRIGGSASEYRARGEFVGLPPWETGTAEDAVRSYRAVLEKHASTRRIAAAAAGRVRVVIAAGWPRKKS